MKKFGKFDIFHGFMWKCHQIQLKFSQIETLCRMPNCLSERNFSKKKFFFNKKEKFLTIFAFAALLHRTCRPILTSPKAQQQYAKKPEVSTPSCFPKIGGCLRKVLEENRGKDSKLREMPKGCVDVEPRNSSN